MILTVIKGPDTGKQFVVNPCYTYIIGRDQDMCQIVLNDTEVSRKHAVLTIDSQGYVLLSDKLSSNGTYLHGVRISASVLVNSGDKITIGDTVLELSLQQNDDYDGSSYESKHESIFDSYAGQGGVVRIHKVDSEITIGRDPTNSVVLNHPHVSRFHSVIEINQQGRIIRDLNSTNGTYVDGSRVVNSYTLSPQSVIRINGYRFTFRGSELVEYDETAGKVRIDIRDLSKVVPLPGGEERVLLNNVSFRVEPQEFVAVLGGSGAGKTALLKALMGTWPANFGEILINGINYYHEYGALQSMIGYVPQDDIVHLDLTVEEVLNYTARLRMPDDTSRDEMAVRVEEIMQVLGLTSRRSNLVRDLSGGQRKRVSIGVELITRPGIMFLDEPTSGLDPGLEKVMMEMMRGMADGGQTIFLVTHATFNIHLCDKVIFLTEGGCLAFFGTPEEALKYFNTDNFAEIYKKVTMEKSPERWQQRYNMSTTAARYQPQSCSTTTGEYSIDAGSTRTSSLFQWYNLTCRYARVMVRDRKNALLLFLQPVVIAVLLSILFYYAAPVFESSPYQPGDLLVTEEAVMAGEIDEISDRSQEESKRRYSMYMLAAAMVLTSVWFGTSNAAREIIKEINIYKRERLVNLRIAPYLMSKAAVFAVVCMVQSIIFLFIIRAVLGFPSFWLGVLAFYLIALTSVMMGLTVSALSANSNNAATAVPILLIPQFLLSGALIPMHQVEPEFFQVFFYLAVSKWGYELIGGGIVDINSLLAFEEPIKALDGSFGLHWFVLLGFILILYLFSTAAMLYKDRDLS